MKLENIINEGLPGDGPRQFYRKLRDYLQKKSQKDKNADYYLRGSTLDWFDSPIQVWHKDLSPYGHGKETMLITWGIKSTGDTYDKGTWLVYANPTPKIWGVPTEGYVRRKDFLSKEVGIYAVYGTLMQYFKDIGWDI